MGLGAQKDDLQLPACQFILARQSFVNSQQDIIARDLSGLKQLAILPAFQAGPLNCMGLVRWEG